ncbi:MAG: 30S ribosomal protein S16 [Chitinophagales bacterium]
MAVKIRLQRRGRTKRPFYHIVIADSRSPRDGKFIEKIGTYDPTTIPATIDINKDKALDWLQKGAQSTPTMNKILSFKGVLYHKHLLRGVKKGVLTQEMADSKWVQWEEKHHNDIMDAQKKGLKGVKKKKKKGEEKAAVAPPVAEAPAS